MEPDNKINVWQNNKDRREKIIDGPNIKDYDRRQHDDPNYIGPERRSGENRRRARNAKTILLVTDNPEDERVALDAFQENNIVNELVVARDGAEALDYLFGTGIYADRDRSKMPHVILLDLNLQKIDSLEVLKNLHEDERTNLIPVVAFTSTEDNRDLTECYRLGVNSFIRKPADSVQLAEIIGQLDRYWLALNESPPPEKEFRNKPIRVLIAEDSEDDVLLLVRQLKKDGYNPTYHQVDTPEAMSKALEKETWDAILCDNSMPGFSPFDALGIYSEKRLNVPFIIVTGAIAYEDAVVIMDAGAHDYILKNDLAELAPAIDRALRKVKNLQE
ncbi:MAG: response regulator [Deltaproteobacteria bacterium]|nr:response regulator [Deltaproteobacteria bacterium]MBW2237712.1 response regulator [Deltaproteobacteria bacterium]MBW2670351.1 response regulator [Deltaproteobacteria bacterium]